MAVTYLHVCMKRFWGKWSCSPCRTTTKYPLMVKKTPSRFGAVAPEFALRQSATPPPRSCLFSHFRMRPECWDVYVSQPAVCTLLHACIETGVLERLPTHCFCTSCPSSQSRAAPKCHNPTQPRCGLGLLGGPVSCSGLRHSPAETGYHTPLTSLLLKTE